MFAIPYDVSSKAVIYVKKKKNSSSDSGEWRWERNTKYYTMPLKLCTVYIYGPWNMDEAF